MAIAKNGVRFSWQHQIRWIWWNVYLFKLASKNTWLARNVFLLMGFLSGINFPRFADNLMLPADVALMNLCWAWNCSSIKWVHSRMSENGGVVIVITGRQRLFIKGHCLFSGRSFQWSRSSVIDNSGWNSEALVLNNYYTPLVKGKLTKWPGKVRRTYLVSLFTVYQYYYNCKRK